MYTVHIIPVKSVKLKRTEPPRQYQSTERTLHYKKENKHKRYVHINIIHPICDERREITAAKLYLNTCNNAIKRQTITFL